MANAKKDHEVLKNTQQSQKSPVSFLTVSSDDSGQRIDNYLISRLKGMPKSHLYRLLRKGEIRVNKKRIAPDYRVVAEDLIRLPPMQLSPVLTPLKPSQSLVELLKSRIIFENDYIMIINKPSGVAVHAGSTIKMGVIEALKIAYSHLPHLELVHRLDTETSGCLILAKKKRILRELHTLLREGAIKKVYWALTKGHWKQDECFVDIPLLKDYRDGGKHVVRVNHKEGKEARTLFETLKEYDNSSLVEATLMTGRTHQIRVHAAYHSHHIAGDDRYGDIEFNKTMRDSGVKRLFLHARFLEFVIPSSGEHIKVEAPLDADLERVLAMMQYQCNQ